MARKLGYRIVIEPDLGGPKGMLVGATIVILASLGACQAAHTIAHELGHAINDEWGGIISNAVPWYVETQMDFVGAAVMMPRRHAALACLRGQSWRQILEKCRCPRTIGAVRLAHKKSRC